MGSFLVSSTLGYLRQPAHQLSGVALDDVRGQLYPMVGLAYPGSKIRARFGLPPPSREDRGGKVNAASETGVS